MAYNYCGGSYYRDYIKTYYGAYIDGAYLNKTYIDKAYSYSLLGFF